VPEIKEKSSLRLNIPVSADVNKGNVVRMEGINIKKEFADGHNEKHSRKLWHQNNFGVRHQNKLGVRHQNKLGVRHQLKFCPRRQHHCTLKRKNLERAFENIMREVYNVNANANDSQLKRANEMREIT
jgi:hypothetical protein